jgi:hypothetical protein
MGLEPAQRGQKHILSLKNRGGTGCQWLTPVILATQEAEVKRIKIQRVRETLSQKPFAKKIGLVE